MAMAMACGSMEVGEGIRSRVLGGDGGSAPQSLGLVEVVVHQNCAKG